MRSNENIDSFQTVQLVPRVSTSGPPSVCEVTRDEIFPEVHRDIYRLPESGPDYGEPFLLEQQSLSFFRLHSLRRLAKMLRRRHDRSLEELVHRLLGNLLLVLHVLKTALHTWKAAVHLSNHYALYHVPGSPGPRHSDSQDNH